MLIIFSRVPLDYFNASLGNASLALARYPATNKAERIGTLLSNPGGPGGSGVNYIYRAGKRLSDILDGKYDIVRPLYIPLKFVLFAELYFVRSAGILGE